MSLQNRPDGSMCFKSYIRQTRASEYTFESALAELTDNSIEVTGEHKEEEKKKNYVRKERHSMSYYQTVPLSEKVIPGKVKAKLTDGVLDVTLPKSKPTPVPKKKPVKVQ